MPHENCIKQKNKRQHLREVTRNANEMNGRAHEKEHTIEAKREPTREFTIEFTRQLQPLDGFPNQVPGAALGIVRNSSPLTL